MYTVLLYTGTYSLSTKNCLADLYVLHCYYYCSCCYFKYCCCYCYCYCYDYYCILPNLLLPPPLLLSNMSIELNADDVSSRFFQNNTTTIVWCFLVVCPKAPRVHATMTTGLMTLCAQKACAAQKLPGTLIWRRGSCSHFVATIDLRALLVINNTIIIRIIAMDITDFILGATAALRKDIRFISERHLRYIVGGQK